MRDEEQNLSLTALVGVQADGRAMLSAEDVHRDALQQLRIPEYELHVKRMTTPTLLLKFATSQLRNRVLDYSGLVAGRTALCLMLWTHQVSASASKVLYGVRVCIEGVPDHAQQIETVA